MITQITQHNLGMKDKGLKRCSSCLSPGSDEPATARQRTSSGFVAVYVGPERRRFVIPTRFLNYPAFVALLGQAKEELGFQAGGGLGLSLPCEIGFFEYVIRCLEEGEARFRSMGLGEFAKMASEVDMEPNDFTLPRV